jgi:hypothetical protein
MNLDTVSTKVSSIFKIYIIFSEILHLHISYDKSKRIYFNYLQTVYYN